MSGLQHASLYIAGDPVAKGRGRIVRRGRHMGVVTPDATRRYEDIVRWTAVQQWSPRPPLDGVPVTLFMSVVLAIPASWSMRKRADALADRVRPTSRPDLDNLVKSITDGLNGVVWRDDSQVVRLVASKHYGSVPGAYVTVRWPAA